MSMIFIFDFDGTLVDTATDVAVCLQNAFKKYGCPVPTVDTIKKLIGQNLDSIVRVLLEGFASDEQIIESVKQDYKKLYAGYSKPHTKPFPGVCQLLQKLKLSGCKLAVNSNKPEELLRQMVTAYFGDGLFSEIVGYIPLRPSKPDPFGVELILKKCDYMQYKAVYIGDGKSDYETAKNANLPFVYVEWGPVQLNSSYELSYRAGSILELENILWNLSF